MTVVEEVLSILSRDLGPSASSFLKRQVSSHLKKDVNELTRADMEELSKWCHVGLKLIIDEPTAERVRRSILALK
jgi:hypothetical protein